MKFASLGELSTAHSHPYTWVVTKLNDNQNFSSVSDLSNNITKTKCHDKLCYVYFFYFCCLHHLDLKKALKTVYLQDHLSLHPPISFPY